MATTTRTSKDALGWIGKTTTLHMQHNFLVHFFAVTVPLRRENAWFHVLWRTSTSNRVLKEHKIVIVCPLRILTEIRWWRRNSSRLPRILFFSSLEMRERENPGSDVVETAVDRPFPSSLRRTKKAPPLSSFLYVNFYFSCLISLLSCLQLLENFGPFQKSLW